MSETKISEALRYWASEDFKCDCHESYIRRNLRDPDCFYCNNKEEIESARAALPLAEHLEAQVVSLRAELAEAKRSDRPFARAFEAAGEKAKALHYLGEADKEIDKLRAQVEQLKNEKRNAEESAIRAGWDLTTLRVDLSNVIDGLGKQVEQLTADKAMREKSRIYAHVPPDEAAIGANQAVEPEGERLRQELTDWLTRNSIVGIMLDTPHHYVDIGSAKLPPLIKPILRLWGSIYIEDSDSSKGPFDVSDNAMKESQ